jgi:hypothetical protein
MSKLKIERIGGLGGFGGANSHLRSSGEIDMNELSANDRKIVEDLFTFGAKKDPSHARDTFRYRISRMAAGGLQSIEVNEEHIPNAVKQCVRDELI